MIFLSAATVGYHLASIYRKLGISRRAGLLLALLDAGLVAEPGSAPHPHPLPHGTLGPAESGQAPADAEVND